MKSLAGVLVLACSLSLAASAQQLQSCSGNDALVGYNNVVDGQGRALSLTAPLLLTDGTVMLQYGGTSFNGAYNPLQDFFALTADSTGCYGFGNGCSATLVPLPTLHNQTPIPYGPAAFASAVLKSGNVIFEGGEGNLSGSPSCSGYNGTGRCEVNLGALYNISTHTWSAVNPPGGGATSWGYIGDAPSTVLADGRFLLGNACGNVTALYTEGTGWATTGNQQSFGSEAGYTLLRSVGGAPANVLSVDTCATGSCGLHNNNSEAYDPNAGTWGSVGSTGSQLPLWGQDYGNCFGGPWAAGEIGPAILQTDGTVFQPGAWVTKNQGPTHAATYNPTMPIGSRWIPAPDLPSVNGSAVTAGDEPAVLLPNGNVLFEVADANYAHGYFLEWNKDSQQYCQATMLSSLPAQTNLMLLPTGQVLITGAYSGIAGVYWIYTPPAGVASGIAPNILTVPADIYVNQTFTVQGSQFNGVSQGSAFGDDFQNATNYPLVQITNDSSHHVFYARTHDHSTMGVATGVSPTYTHFDVLPGTETGASHLVVIANGVASNSFSVTVH